jgi:hypothetical protein
MTDNFSADKTNENTAITSSERSNSKAPAKKENMLANILMNIAIPTLILIKLSGDTFMDHPWGLGPKWALIVALAFPIGYGIKDFISQRKLNLFSGLGIISVLLTGGISLMHLDTKYYAIKEAAIPAIIGLIFIISTKTRYPLVRTFIYNENLLKVDKIASILKERGNEEKFERTLRNGSYLLAFSYFVCAVLNYVLAKMIVVSPTGTPEFNVEIGKMHMVGLGVIVVPSILFLAATLFYIFRDIRLLTGLTLEEAMVDESADKSENDTQS